MNKNVVTLLTLFRPHKSYVTVMILIRTNMF